MRDPSRTDVESQGGTGEEGSETRRGASEVWRAFALVAHAADVLGLRPRRPSRRPRRALKTADEVFRATDRLEEALWTANALAVALETGLLADLAKPVRVGKAAERTGLPAPVAGAVLDILVGLGFATREADAGGDVFRASAGVHTLLAGSVVSPSLAAALRSPLLQAEDLRRRASEGTVDPDGWRFTDRGVIEAQGDLTAAMAEKAVPKLRFLPGLVPALRKPGALLLDVGAGAAGVSLTLCRRFPALRAVALEPAPASAAIARAKVAEAGLADRIEVRAERIEHLSGGERFDLVFLPQMFLPDPVFDAAARTVLAALKPGGWLLAAVLSRQGADLRSSVARLRTALWGGNARDDAAVARVLRAARFHPVIRSPRDAAVQVVCARRPPA
jgi:SAM-dependent methyltransferase